MCVGTLLSVQVRLRYQWKPLPSLCNTVSPHAEFYSAFTMKKPQYIYVYMYIKKIIYIYNLMILSYCYTSRTVQLALLYGYSWHLYKRIRCDRMLQASFRLLTLYENSKIVFVSIISKVNFSLNTAKVIVSLLKKKGLSNVGHVIIPFHSIQVSREIRGQGNCRTSSRQDAIRRSAIMQWHLRVHWFEGPIIYSGSPSRAEDRNFSRVCEIAETENCFSAIRRT